MCFTGIYFTGSIVWSTLMIIPCPPPPMSSCHIYPVTRSNRVVCYTILSILSSHIYHIIYPSLIIDNKSINYPHCNKKNIAIIRFFSKLSIHYSNTIMWVTSCCADAALSCDFTTWCGVDKVSQIIKCCLYWSIIISDCPLVLTVISGHIVYILIVDGGDYIK